MQVNAVGIPFKKMDKGAIIPTFGGDDVLNAGMDFYAIHGCVIRAGGYARIDTGIAWDGMALITEWEKPMIEIKSRSGLAFNSSIEASNAGVIDASYRGNIKVKLYNRSQEDYAIKTGERIAQGIFKMLPICSPIEIEEFATPETLRGENGFGSTGK